MSTQLFEKIAKDYGTPLYIYFEAQINKQIAALKLAVAELPCSICYAVKANSNLNLLRHFYERGCGFDIVSEGELRRVIHACGDTSKVVFSGVGKSPSEIEFALRSKIKLINVESAQELSVIAETASNLGVKAPVAFRINPDISVDVHPYIATGMRSSKFGLPAEEALALWEGAKRDPALELIGVDCHIGSQISDVEPLKSAYSQLIEVAGEFRSRAAPIKVLDFGGGLGVSFSGHYQPLDLQKFSQMLKDLHNGLDYEIIFEPGKFLIAEAGVLLTRVVYTKQNGEHKFVIVDGGMNDLIRPSLYDAFHHVELIPGGGGTRELDTVDIVGPVCESGCYFAKRRVLPRANPGDLVAIYDSGAYGFSMASNYNSRPLPAEVLVREDGTVQLIRKRQEAQDMWREELL
ncbi:MAG: diaminopimelate decarboxylase [Proteobacteria bacterium]|nr:MAG: diaminopimelate decarboxylase [Pseudomonadota bacterium]